MKDYTNSINNCDITRPETWTRYKKGLCKTCYSGCCTLLIEVTADDLIRLEFATQKDFTFDLQYLIKKLKQQKILKRYNPRTQKFTLQEQASGDCPFLDTNRLCTVYEKRPQVCRDHPVVASPKKGYCPYKRKY